MLNAKQLRKTNIAEYILYMWQIEDLLRACSFDDEAIAKQLVNRFEVDEPTRREITDWYKNLSVMMEKEHVQREGHLQVLINLVDDLNEFHLKMLEVQNDKEYVRLYAENRGAIAQLMNNLDSPNEIAACFNALYSFMLMNLKKAEISASLQTAINQIAHQTGHLSARYLQFENDEFEF